MRHLRLDRETTQFTIGSRFGTGTRMKESNRQELIDFWKTEEQQPFEGWDFSYVEGRMIEDEPPLSFYNLASGLMKNSASVLDMGTGGGEFLLTLKKHWPDRVVVTEEYPPNLKLARDRLVPLGVEIVEAKLNSSDSMPFGNGDFDLVLNRHSDLNPAEVGRILSPGGTFLIQQVHGLWATDLLAAFDKQPPWPFATPAFYARKLRNAGLMLEKVEEWTGRLSFKDVGAIVYYLKAVPWYVPGFAVETHLEYLFGLQDRQGESFLGRKWLIGKKIKKELDKPEGISHAKMV